MEEKTEKIEPDTLAAVMQTYRAELEKSLTQHREAVRQRNWHQAERHYVMASLLTKRIEGLLVPRQQPAPGETTEG